MKIYNKLVRDNIPEIIEADNCTCKTRILSDEEYLKELNIKLKEELNEYLESGDIEELADMEEVLRAIVKVKNCSHEKFEEIRVTKANKRGAFNKKIFLVGTEEKND